MKRVFATVLIFICCHSLTVSAQPASAGLQNISEESLKHLLFNKWRLSYITIADQKMDMSSQAVYTTITKDYIENTANGIREKGSYSLDFNNRTILVDAEDNQVEKLKILSISPTELRVEYREEKMADHPGILVYKRV